MMQSTVTVFISARCLACPVLRIEPNTQPKEYAMEGWHYIMLAAAATVVPALGLSLLCRAEYDRDAERRQPRWARGKAALVAAMGGAMAVSALPRDKVSKASTPEDGPGKES
jgi:hypothetical protein